MLLCYSPQSERGLKPILGQLLVLGRQVFNRQPQIVRVLHHRQELFRLGQRHLPVTWLSGCLLDPFVHGVHNRPSEVRLWVRQPGLVVGASSLGQRQVTLRLEVWVQDSTLPGGAGLDEKLGEHVRQGDVLNDEGLPFF